MELYADVRRSVYVEGLSERAAARRFGLARETVRKMLRDRLPPGYRRHQPVRRPKLDAFTGIIDQILSDDQHRPKKQRHTAKRICERLRAEHAFTGGYTIVKASVRVQKQLAKQDLLIVDELGYVPLSKTGAELLFEIFSQRDEQASTLVTSNLPFNEWTEIFGSERLTGALLDRLTHHVHILELNGDSSRLAHSKHAHQDATAPAS